MGDEMGAMRFRCCGNRSSAGHAADCVLKPPEYQPPPARQQTNTERQEQEEGCQFDILRFQHIGACKGTCDEQELIRFAGPEDGDELVVIIVLIAPDDEHAEEKIRKLGERGFKRLSDEELVEIVARHKAGDLRVQVITMTLGDLEEQTRPKDPYLDVRECAEILGFSKSWVRTLCRRGRFEGAIKLMREWAIPQSAILIPD